MHYLNLPENVQCQTLSSISRSTKAYAILMALNKNFEPVRISLLHRVPLPSLESTIFELISKETRLGIGKSTPTDVVLVVHSSFSHRPSSFHQSMKIKTWTQPILHTMENIENERNISTS